MCFVHLYQSFIKVLRLFLIFLQSRVERNVRGQATKRGSSRSLINLFVRSTIVKISLRLF